MLKVNMLEAKTDLSKLVKLLEDKKENIIYIARNGESVAQLTLIDTPKPKNIIGIAKGKFDVPDDFNSDELNSEIENMFFSESEGIF